jgi:hypothetical protein
MHGLTRRPFSRRQFLGTIAVAGIAGLADRTVSAKDPSGGKSLEREVGVTTSSFSRHLVANPGKGQFSMLELPRIMRDELDMRVIDLNTSSLGSQEPKWLEKVRTAVADAGCVMINLKLNQRGLDMNSPDREVRTKALNVYKQSIDAASMLGIGWARPLPLKETPDMAIHVASYRELADYGAERNVRMLVENYAWMESDPQSVVKLIKAIDRDVKASPDTGNWKDNTVRFPGLAATFPHAVTCDFKARQLGPQGEHPLYDLKRCFQTGWDTGFRGPWCLEHAHADRRQLFRDLAILRDMLRGWMA